MNEVEPKLKLFIEVFKNGSIRLGFKLNGKYVKQKTKLPKACASSKLKSMSMRSGYQLRAEDDIKDVKDIKEKPVAYELAMQKATLLNVHKLFQGNDVETNRRVSLFTSLPLALMMVNLSRTLNAGTMVRTAAGFSFRTAYIVGSEKIDKRAFLGSQHYINLKVYKNIENFVTFFQKEKLIPILVEQGGVDCREINFKRFIKEEEKKLFCGYQFCLVFGSEADGIPKSLMNISKKSHILSIPMIGIIRSHNVSMAAAILMYLLSTGFYECMKHLL